MNRFIFLLFFLVSSATFSHAQAFLTTTSWCTDVTTFDQWLAMDNVVLYSDETTTVKESYFEFRGPDFTFYSDRALVTDENGKVMEEVVSPYEGIYTLKDSVLTLEFADGKKVRTYAVTFPDRNTLQLKLIQPAKK